ncbi:MAG TPA: hypothetical protein VFD97_00135 [Acidimicrobiia bacterium]|nr:hypothetical protein [Acidimicrobiia bacterium]
MIDGIMLEPEQEELLSTLVEITRNTPREDRGAFMVVRMLQGDILVSPGRGPRPEVYYGDVEILASKGLVNMRFGDRGTPNFDVTPEGFEYYRIMKERSGKPMVQIEDEVTKYLEAHDFQQRYPKAYAKWREAAAKLWAGDSQNQLTTIGHLCREAVQEFATALVEKFQPPGAPADKARDQSRIRAVLAHVRDQLGSREVPLLEAMIDYWSAVSGLIQRQEHGGQKQGDDLRWEDGRRVVFQTAVVMFEIDHSLASLT